MKVGIYICHCGRNIAGTIDVTAVQEYTSRMPYVVIARDYRYMCSDPGQALIREDIAKYKLDRVVVAACSPTMHKTTFMNNVQKAGLNPYCLERANIREQCSWVHPDRTAATNKALSIISAAEAKILLSQPLFTHSLPVVQEAMVIGGGIAGIQSALDLANTGFKTYLVEQSANLGGHVVQLHQTFPSLEKATDMLALKLTDVRQHPKIEILTSTKLVEFNGYFGNFRVKVQTNSGNPEATREISIGAIIVATGYEVFDAKLKPEYGYGIYPQVITGMELERIDEAGGPTQGKIEINGKTPRNIVFIQCVGSRDKSVGVEYCSRVCCMYTAKQALYIKNKLPDAKVTVCYIDIRAFGKGYEQFYERAQSEGVIYRRGVVSEVYRRGDKVIVRAEDTILSETYEEEADMVVLATGLQPGKDTINLSRMLNIPVGSDGFFLEAHPKLGPVETTTDGIFLAGCCQGPKDITDAIAQGHAAAVKASIPLLLGKVNTQAIVVSIDTEVCAGCRLCEKYCAYNALVFDTRRHVMTINETLCRGCGACSTACPSGANQLKNYNKKQVFNIIDALT
jgi:heterodisulfide reductase subunit A